MIPKAMSLNVRISGLTPPAALILKQEMLALGGDCANHRQVLKNDIDRADAVLMGSVKIFRRLIPKLRMQPFGLKELANDLQVLLARISGEKKIELPLKKRILRLSERTHIMGILNVTPDSFSDGGKFLDKNAAVAHALEMIADGADLVDVGAESTRPGAKPVDLEEEMSRVIPVIAALRRESDVPISVDTYKAQVAEAALEAGADIINDISGMRFDPKMKEAVAKYQAPVVLMHIKGEPRNMQKDPVYEDLMTEIYQYLSESIELAESAGLPREKIIIDPGIGFGKRLKDNYEILRRLSEFRSLGCPILVGPSRKSFIGNVLNLPPDQRLEGSAAAVALSIASGADIVRVHDVKEMKRVCVISDLISGKTRL
ncbi:MAG: dihydropteroate synthase [Calditrichaeota bacterium]|nr:dihydropteroate synthase [Calditrichota bacterium]